MEFRTNGGSGSVEVDSELDMVGVKLEKPIVCGFCLRSMERIGKNNFRCERCGMVYESK
jgi:tRNA(Ile2) C34 agmatinyltransferase TiaS